MSRRGRFSDAIIAAVFTVVCIVLWFADFYPNESEKIGEKFPAKVLSVDNSAIFKVGLLERGEQRLKVEILSGSRKGQVFDAVNLLRAQMDLDKTFSVGDTAWVSAENGAVPEKSTINAQDFYRSSKTLWLFALFSAMLVLFGGFTGVKALLSFVFSCLVVWKILVPACLRGGDPIAICLAAVCVLSAAIIFLVAGFTKKGFAAFAGTMLGVLSSCAMAWYFSGSFKVNGAVMPYSQALLYSGYEFLNLTELFIGALFLSSSGAVMDLSMDVAAGMGEVAEANPSLGRRRLLKAGLSIGRSVVGTMTTTLLLAYSGGYLTLMMAFAANSVELGDFINNPYVCAEAVKTLVGSFGLVLVAPFTAIVGCFIFGSGAGRASIK